MKKFVCGLGLIWILCLVPMLSVEAGNINSAESALVGIACGTYEYNGSYYAFKSEYIGQVSSYLSRDDVDLTEEQVNNYISQFYSNLGGACGSEYMYKVGDAPKSADTAVPETTGEQDAEAENQDDPNTADAFEPSEYTVEATDLYMHVSGTKSLNVREYPFVQAKAIGTLAENEKVHITGIASTGWLQIEYKEKTGFVSARYMVAEDYEERIQEAEAGMDDGYLAELTGQEEHVTEATQAEGKDQTVIGETEEQSQEETAAVTETDTQKDYGDAKAFNRQPQLEMILILTAVLIVIVLAVIVIMHKAKYKKR